MRRHGLAGDAHEGVLGACRLVQQLGDLTSKHRRRGEAEDERGGVVRVDEALVDVAFDDEREILLVGSHIAFRIERERVEELCGPDERQEADVRGEQHGRHASRAAARTGLQIFVIDRTEKGVLDDEDIEDHGQNARLERRTIEAARLVCRDTYDDRVGDEFLPEARPREKLLHRIVAVLVEDARQKGCIFRQDDFAAREDEIVRVEHEENAAGDEQGEENRMVACRVRPWNAFRLLEAIGGHDDQNPRGDAAYPLRHERIDTAPAEIELTAQVNIVALRQHHVQRVREQHADIQQRARGHELTGGVLP